MCRRQLANPRLGRTTANTKKREQLKKAPRLEAPSLLVGGHTRVTLRGETRRWGERSSPTFSRGEPAWTAQRLRQPGSIARLRTPVGRSGARGGQAVR